jgi:hypothetical protein
LSLLHPFRAARATPDEASGATLINPGKRILLFCPAWRRSRISQSWVRAIWGRR